MVVVRCLTSISNTLAISAFLYVYILKSLTNLNIRNISIYAIFFCLFSLSLSLSLTLFWMLFFLIISLSISHSDAESQHEKSHHKNPKKILVFSASFRLQTMCLNHPRVLSVTKAMENETI